jgi:hypothetical protein
MRMLRALVGAALLLPGIAAADGRYQAVPVQVGSDIGGKVLIVDTQTGDLWTWMEVGAGDHGPGGRFLVYQGRLRAGTKPGEVIEQQDFSGPR